MTKVPASGGVERALRGVKREIKGSLKQIHQNASKLLSRGNYAGAQTLVDVARAVKSFDAEVDTLRDKWLGLRGGGAGSGTHGAKTPLWEYYRPILQALAAVDGRASLSELFAGLEPALTRVLKPDDFEPMANGRPRWQVMVRRARRAMRKEGFVEIGGGKEWRITGAGRKAATAPTASK